MSAAAKTEPNLVTLTIDNTEVTTEAGKLIIRAAEEAGIRIPRFCDHPLLKPVAACRQCLVEVGTPDRDGNLRMMPKPQPSCAITVSPGMVVKTQHTSQAAHAAQQGVMEFLLINHPLDCPICDKGGECPLQNQAMSEGRDDTRFTAAKRVYPKPMRLTTQILLDRERCILCQRCVRFAREIPGDAFIDLQGRGGGSSPTDDHYFMAEQIGTFDAEVLGFSVPGVKGPEQTDISGPYGEAGIISSVYAGPEKKSEKDLAGRTFASYFSGNIIQICPVGALTSNTYRFLARPFDLVSTPSIAEHDASGSGVRIDIRRGEIMRKLSENVPEGNEEWITDKDRFGYFWFRQDDRLKMPLVREDGKLVPTSWSDALDRAAQGLAKAVDKNSGKSVGLLPGGRVTFEDAWAWSKFARTVLGTNNVDARWRAETAEEEQFLAALVAGRGLAVTYDDVEKASQVVLIGLEPEDECGSLFLRLRKGVTAGTTKVTTVAPWSTRGSQKLNAELLMAAPGEEVAVVAGLDSLADDAVILVGERAARTPGLLSAAADLAKRTGARLQWIPRRSGERGAIDAGLLPGLLPFGRLVTDDGARDSLEWGTLPAEEGMSAAEILDEAAQGNLGALILGGLDVRDWPDPQKALKAVKETDFVVSLEVRQSELTELADVVFPVAPPAEKNGTFVNWEGRLRPFGQALTSSTLPDREVLHMLAEEMGSDLGLRTLEQLYAEVNPHMLWRGKRASAPIGGAQSAAPIEGAQGAAPVTAQPSSKKGAKKAAKTGDFTLASHKVMVDLGRMLDGATDLALSARQPVALISKVALDQLGATEDDSVRIEGARGSMTLPVEVTEIDDHVIWVPECSVGSGINVDLAPAGSTVTVTAVREADK
mgnify:CR=1 FL=1